MEEDVLRRVRLAPYRKGKGPTFSLVMYDTHRTDGRGCTKIGYRLTMREDGKSTLLFSGEDFAGSPGRADDADLTAAALLGFLTLKPGDTDAEYFAKYTEAQKAFCDAHAESLATESLYRFGDD
jgi:hypothetical protein